MWLLECLKWQVLLALYFCGTILLQIRIFLLYFLTILNVINHLLSILTVLGMAALQSPGPYLVPMLLIFFFSFINPWVSYRNIQQLGSNALNFPCCNFYISFLKEDLFPKLFCFILLLSSVIHRYRCPNLCWNVTLYLIG